MAETKTAEGTMAEAIVARRVGKEIELAVGQRCIVIDVAGAGVAEELGVVAGYVTEGNGELDCYYSDIS